MSNERPFSAGWELNIVLKDYDQLHKQLRSRGHPDYGLEILEPLRRRGSFNGAVRCTDTQNYGQYR